ncbi:MAG TPA: hypothetical protein GXZ90_03165 [Clostridiales bacterium]|nr:hypothetical protein [Clostridiales bacterium]
MDREKTKELKVGQEFKNYIAIAEWLGVEPTKGKGRKYHIEEFETYCTYKKQGHKYIITEVFEEKKERIENRGKHNNHYNPNEVYAKYMDLLVMELMQKEGFILESFTAISTEIIPLFNEMYKDMSFETDEFADFAGIGPMVITEYCKLIRGKFKDTFESSLKRLQKQGHIRYKVNWVVLSYSYNQLIATDEEVEIIKQIEDDVIEEMEITKFLAYLPHNYKRFKQKVNAKLWDKLEAFNYWKVYNIELINKEMEDITTEQVEDAMDQLTKLFIIATHKSLNNISYKTKRGNTVHKYQYEERLYQILMLDDYAWNKYEYFIDTENQNYMVLQGYKLKSPQTPIEEPKENTLIEENKYIKGYDKETDAYLPF